MELGEELQQLAKTSLPKLDNTLQYRQFKTVEVIFTNLKNGGKEGVFAG